MVNLSKLLSEAGYKVSIDAPSIPRAEPIVVTPVEIPDLPKDIKPEDINLHQDPPPPEPIVLTPLPPIDLDNLKKAIANGETISIDFTPS